jgi:hypothetical protein
MIEIYGASDDLIEVVGDITEEFDGGRHNIAQLLAFSDGTLLRIRFDEEGVWRITPIRRGAATLTVVPGCDEDGTDRARLVGDVAWVMHGHNHATAGRRAGATT